MSHLFGVYLTLAGSLSKGQKLATAESKALQEMHHALKLPVPDFLTAYVSGFCVAQCSDGKSALEEVMEPTPRCRCSASLAWRGGGALLQQHAPFLLHHEDMLLLHMLRVSSNFTWRTAQPSDLAGILKHAHVRENLSEGGGLLLVGPGQLRNCFQLPFHMAFRTAHSVSEATVEETCLAHTGTTLCKPPTWPSPSSSRLHRCPTQKPHPAGSKLESGSVLCTVSSGEKRFLRQKCVCLSGSASCKNHWP